METFGLGMEGAAWGGQDVRSEEVQVRPEEVEWTQPHDLGHCFIRTVGGHLPCS